MKKMIEKKLKRLAELCLEGAVLDVGFAQEPNIYLTHPVGIDIQLPAEVPDSYQEIHTCNLNYERIPTKDGIFSTVVAGNIIEHVENPSFFLREINRVLKDNGRLIVSTPQANDWWTTLHNWFFRKWINDPDKGEHLQNWTFLDMTRLLKKNGFEVEQIEGFYLRFPRLRFRIPVRRFPALSWEAIYIAKKIAEPTREILVYVDKRETHV